MLGLTESVLAPPIQDFAAESPLGVEWPAEVMTWDFHYGAHVEKFRFDRMDYIIFKDDQGLNNRLWLGHQFIDFVTEK